MPKSETTLVGQYARVFGSTVIGRGTAMAATLGFLWFLNRELGERIFGIAVLAFTITALVGAIGGAAFEKTVLYRTAYAYGGEKHEAVRHIVWRALPCGVLVGVLLAAGLAFSAPLIGDGFGKPNLTPWIIGLSVIVPLDIAVAILAAGRRGQQDIRAWIVSREILPSVTRLAVFLVAVAVVGPFSSAISAYAISFVVPVAYLLFLTNRPMQVRKDTPAAVFSREDKIYGLKMSLTQLINRPSKSIDLLVVGALGSELTLAHYALASRLVLMAAIVRQAISNLLVPRLGAMFALDQWKDLRREYGITREVSVFAALLVTAGGILFGESLLAHFGEYRPAAVILIALFGVVVVRSAFGDSGGYLQMRGYAGVNLTVTALGFSTFLGIAWTYSDPVEGVEVALAMLAATVVQRISACLWVWWCDDFSMLPISSLVPASLAVSSAVAVSLGYLSIYVGGGLVGVAMAGVVLNAVLFYR